MSANDTSKHLNFIDYSEPFVIQRNCVIVSYLSFLTFVSPWFSIILDKPNQQVSLPLEHQFIINRYDITNSQKLIYSWLYQDLCLQLKLQKYIISKRIYHFFCFVSYFGKVLSVCKSISYNSPRNQKVGILYRFPQLFLYQGVRGESCLWRIYYHSFFENVYKTYIIAVSL